MQSSRPHVVERGPASALRLLGELEHERLSLEVLGGRPRICPASHLSPAQRRYIRRNRDDLIVLVECRDQDDVRRRVEVMSRQVVPGRALPLLTMRHVINPDPHACVSCEAPVPGPTPTIGTGRCAACRGAAWIVTNEVRRTQVSPETAS